MPKSKKTVICPLCRQTNVTKFWAMPGYKLAKCANCSLVWDPFPLDNTLVQYEKNYFVNDNPKGGYANYFEGMRINRQTFSDRLRRIAKKTGFCSHLIDVGSALGDCLLEAQKLKWDHSIGVEPSLFACKESQKRGVKAICTTLENSDLPSNKFNVALSQDVIEHIPDPVTNLKQINRILKPNGWLFLVTPNIGGLWSKVLGSRWYHYKPVEHIIYFSPATIKVALKNAGFKNIEVHRTYHIMSLEYIINRFQYYFPHLGPVFLKIIRATPFKDIALKLYTGELEAWAQK